MKKVLRVIRQFLKSPKINVSEPGLAIAYETFIPRDKKLSPTEKTHMRNMQEIALAEFKLQREALQKNLTIMHRTAMISLLAVLISIFALVVAVINKPQVHVSVSGNTGTILK
jgi:hypothetical protein